MHVDEQRKRDSIPGSGPSSRGRFLDAATTAAAAEGSGAGCSGCIWLPSADSVPRPTTAAAALDGAGATRCLEGEDIIDEALFQLDRDRVPNDRPELELRSRVDPPPAAPAPTAAAAAEDCASAARLLRPAVAAEETPAPAPAPCPDAGASDRLRLPETDRRSSAENDGDWDGDCDWPDARLRPGPSPEKEEDRAGSCCSPLLAPSAVTSGSAPTSWSTRTSAYLNKHNRTHRQGSPASRVQNTGDGRRSYPGGMHGHRYGPTCGG